MNVGKDKIFLVDFDLPPRRAKKEAASGMSAAKKQQLIKTASGAPLHVVVIGGGISGLACASKLTKAGFMVTFINGTDGNPLFEYLTKSLPDIKLHRAREDTLSLRDTFGRAIDNAVVFDGYSRFTKLMEQVGDMYPKDNSKSHKISLHDALQH